MGIILEQLDIRIVIRTGAGGEHQLHPGAHGRRAADSSRRLREQKSDLSETRVVLSQAADVRLWIRAGRGQEGKEARREGAGIFDGEDGMWTDRGQGLEATAGRAVPLHSASIPHLFLL